MRGCEGINKGEELGPDTSRLAMAEKAAEVKPTEVAKEHGNKPSRGAEIDEELENEDEQRVKEKEGK